MGLGREGLERDGKWIRVRERGVKAFELDKNCPSVIAMFIRI